MDSFRQQVCVSASALWLTSQEILISDPKLTLPLKKTGLNTDRSWAPLIINSITAVLCFLFKLLLQKQTKSCNAYFNYIWQLESCWHMWRSFCYIEQCPGQLKRHAVADHLCSVPMGSWECRQHVEPPMVSRQVQRQGSHICLSVPLSV